MAVLSSGMGNCPLVASLARLDIDARLGPRALGSLARSHYTDDAFASQIHCCVDNNLEWGELHLQQGCCQDSLAEGHRREAPRRAEPVITHHQPAVMSSQASNTALQLNSVGVICRSDRLVLLSIQSRSVVVGGPDDLTQQ